MTEFYSHKMENVLVLKKGDDFVDRLILSKDLITSLSNLTESFWKSRKFFWRGSDNRGNASEI